MKRLPVLAIAVFVLSTQPAWATRTRVHEMAESSRYGQKAGGMLAVASSTASPVSSTPWSILSMKPRRVRRLSVRLRVLERG